MDKQENELNSKDEFNKFADLTKKLFSAPKPKIQDKRNPEPKKTKG